MSPLFMSALQLLWSVGLSHQQSEVCLESLVIIKKGQVNKHMRGCENCKSPLSRPILQNYKAAPLGTNVWPTLNSPLAAALSSSLLSLSPLFTLSNFACVPVPYFSIIQTCFFNYVGHSEGEVQRALHHIKKNLEKKPAHTDTSPRRHW